MKTIYTNSIPGNKNKDNEDLYAVAEHYAILLDGSTALSSKTDVIWYVNTLLSYIKHYIQEDITLTDVLEYSIEDMKDAYFKAYLQPQLEEEIPCACVLMVRERKNKIELLNLGDSTILYQLKDGSVHVFDQQTSLRTLDHNLLQQAFDLSKTEHISMPEALQRDTIVGRKKENRKLKNKASGYYIASIEKEVIKHAATKTIDRNTIDYILLASDGLTEWYTTMNLGDASSLIKTMVQSKEEVFHTLKKAQENDPNLLNLRLKQSDDTTGVLLQITDS